MVRTKGESRRRVEEIVEQVSGELLERYRPAFEANPKMKLIEIVNPNDPMALWFTHSLISETRVLEWLTVVLIGLTVVLALLTFRLAFL